MTQVDEGSAKSVTDVLGDDTPSAQALWDLRKRVYGQKIGPGAVTDIARELGYDRGRLNKLIAPSTIKLTARVERHISDSS